MWHYLAQLAVKILCDDSTGCDEVDKSFVTEADNMKGIVCEDDFDEL